MIQECITWPQASSIKQLFSLPSSIIYYISKNPSTPKCYSKMIQSCKYFFEKNPIFIIKNMDENIICSNEKFVTDYCKAADILKIPVQFWLTSKLLLYCVSPKCLSTILPKIYRCEIKQILINETKLNYDDFKMLAASAEIITLADVEMTYSNGNVVLLESILEAIPNAVEFLYKFSTASVITTSTVKNISKLKNLSNLRRLTLFWVPQTFNINDLIAFSKNNKDLKSFLYYAPNEISQEYKNQLNAAMKARKEFCHHKVYISYKNWAFPRRLIFLKKANVGY